MPEWWLLCCVELSEVAGTEPWTSDPFFSGVDDNDVDGESFCLGGDARDVSEALFSLSEVEETVDGEICNL